MQLDQPSSALLAAQQGYFLIICENDITLNFRRIASMISQVGFFMGHKCSYHVLITI